jgi:electron-transferring-flavoprotein dehydrogenase
MGKYTVFAEGSRGHLGKQLISRFKLDAGRDPQSYSIGIKEVWEIDARAPQGGPRALHTRGLAARRDDTYGGSWMYHMENNQVSIGFVVGARLQQPLPVAIRGIPALQDAPQHPLVLREARASSRPSGIAYGARALTVGGILSLPKTVFPGGALVGDDAGYLNASRIKGSHAAIKTGMLCRRSGVRGTGRWGASTTSSPRTRRRSRNRGCTRS